MAKGRRKIPIVAEEMAEHIELTLSASGMTVTKSRNISRNLSVMFMSVYSGQSIRFPSGSERAAELLVRDAEIKRRYDGKNALALAREFSLTPARISQILSDYRKHDRK